MLPAKRRQHWQITVYRFQFFKPEARFGGASADRKEKESTVLQIGEDRHLVLQFDVLVIAPVILGQIETIGRHVPYKHRACFFVLTKPGIKWIELVNTIEIHIEVDTIGCPDRIVNMKQPILFIEQRQQDTDKGYIDPKIIEHVGQKTGLPKCIDRPGQGLCT